MQTLFVIKGCVCRTHSVHTSPLRGSIPISLLQTYWLFVCFFPREEEPRAAVGLIATNADSIPKSHHYRHGPSSKQQDPNQDCDASPSWGLLAPSFPFTTVETAKGAAWHTHRSSTCRFPWFSGSEQSEPVHLMRPTSYPLAP